MRLEAFFEEFDLIAGAPDAIAKMRGLILRLAMQGELSQPHAMDGPVSQLLREVEKDRARLGLESSVKSLSGNPEFSGDEAMDAIPKRWTLVRFGSIARHNAGKTLDKGRNRGQLRDYITTSNLYWGFFQLDAVRQMPILEDELERCTALKGDLLICEGGEAGRAAVWPHDHQISFQNHIHRARFFAGINPYFVQRYFEKLNVSGEIDRYRKGVGISNMSGKALASIPIPLPPLAEQRRIVAKVDELMALCDRLDAQQQERETRHAALARASLARFAEAPTPANLDLLFHKSYSIPPADLRKSIITLAIQGKLVPQDPNDKSSEELLRAVAAERLSSDSIDAREPVKENEVPFPLPSSWKWVRLGVVASIKHGYAFSGESFTTEPTGFVLTTPGNFYESGGFRDRGANTKYYKGEVPSAFVFEAGDLIIPMTEQAAGLLGSPAFIPDDGNTYLHNQRLGKLEFSCDQVAPAFVYWFFNSNFFRGELARTCTGMKVRHTSPKRILKVPFPLCPLAEQRRIVAKVDELMARVDALESQITKAHNAGSKLVSAVVAELTQGRALA